MAMRIAGLLLRIAGVGLVAVGLSRLIGVWPREAQGGDGLAIVAGGAALLVLGSPRAVADDSDRE